MGSRTRIVDNSKDISYFLYWRYINITKGGIIMGTESLALLQELAQARWSDVGSPENDYKLEQANLPSQPGIFYTRKKHNPGQIYVAKVIGGDGWKCVKCATVILGAQVAHPIHDGPFPLSGSGECSYENAPYCPTCEEKPSFHGSIITIG